VSFIYISNSTTLGDTIERPKGYDGPIIFEAELGIVIGKECRNIDEGSAASFIFGYTCVNDVTATGLLNKDFPGFQQWTRCKGYDTFCPLGPAIVTDLDTNNTELRVQGVLDGEKRQDYPVSDMVFSPHQIVAAISQIQTLMPGDLISCGTSLGVKPMEPGSKVDITVPGVGTLSNVFDV
jgi:2-keto-4-pentenoate hydratase/2-oxohepta-3-ene-1,7-dioic acid hydratase in catechol pathway